uniref:Uncharacterized protein n=1 Tax=Cacopsylla melanoneura TaxID=428564 RepID=A0A8D8T371_9HEMI
MWKPWRMTSPVTSVSDWRRNRRPSSSVSSVIDGLSIWGIWPVMRSLILNSRVTCVRRSLPHRLLWRSTVGSMATVLLERAGEEGVSWSQTRATSADACSPNIQSWSNTWSPSTIYHVVRVHPGVVGSATRG